MASVDAPPAPRHRVLRTLPLSSGWVPALVGYLVIALALKATGVTAGDVLVFSAYVGLGLALPGTLMWRAAAGGQPRTFVGDLVLGTCLAYAVELFWYLCVRAAGVPLLVLAWPVVVVALSLLPRWRSRLWRPAEVRRMPIGWSWGMAAVVSFSFAYLAHNVWGPSPVSPAALRFPYVDEPYHLSLLAELRHHFPVASPVVDGEPLYYHWFAHAEMAATSWVTGIEPVVLLQRLSLAPMIVLILMGSAVLAERVTGSAALGLLAPALLTVAGSAEVGDSFGAPLLAERTYLSPTTPFAQMLLIPILALGLALLHGERARAPVWLALGVLLAAVSGGKATVLPYVVAGAIAVIVVAVLDRRLHRRALAVAGMGVVAFGLAQVLVFGGESRGLRVDPLHLSASTAQTLELAAGRDSVGLGVLLLLTAAYLLQQLAFAAGAVGLARDGRWRDPRVQFLAVAAAAAAGATLVFGHDHLSQLYFILTAPVVFAVLSVWGLGALVAADVSRRSAGALAVAAIGGLGVALLLQWLEAHEHIGLGAHRSPWGLVQPYALAVLGVIGISALAWAAIRRLPWLRGLTGAVAVAATYGLCLPSAVELGRDIARDPVPAAYEQPPEEQATIGRAGIKAARWLRDQSGADDLVATNAHCRFAGRERCDTRTFWLSGYAERRILVEGWGYQVSTAPLAEQLNQPDCCLPFWDPDLLADNDAAFSPRSRSDVDDLRDQYGVDWLVVDRRTPHRLRLLRRYAEVVFEAGDYLVLRTS